MADFMSDAYEYNETHISLMKHIKENIKSTDYVCDAGCGLGYMSLALSNYCTAVDAVDLAVPPLKILEENIIKQDIKNIQVIKKDIHDYIPEKLYDVMVFSFFGSMKEALTIGKRLCQNQLILFKNDSTHHRFSLKSKPNKGHTFESAKRILEEYQIPFTVEKVTMEMGQPFRKVEDAYEFFTLYNRDPETSLDLEEIHKGLVKIEHEEFKYFYSVIKPIAIIKIKTVDIPDMLKGESYEENNRVSSKSDDCNFFGRM